MNDTEIRSMFESIKVDGKNIPEVEVNEIINEISSAFRKLESKKTVDSLVTITTIEESLKNEMAKEPDWRKKASLAARILSLNL